MAVTTEKSVPYAPATAIIDLIDRYRHRGLQSPITAEVLGRAGVTDSLIPRTLQALITLELIDESGTPTQTFEGLRLAVETDFKQSMAEWLQTVYAEVFSFVDPAADEETRIRDAFRPYNPKGQQTRAVSLFLGLCKEAGLRGAGPEKQQPAQRRRKLAGSSGAISHTQKPRQRVQQQPPATETRIPAPISGLLSKLPADGESWTQAERDKMEAAFSAMLDFCYPIKEKSEETEAEPAE